MPGARTPGILRGTDSWIEDGDRPSKAISGAGLTPSKGDAMIEHKTMRQDLLTPEQIRKISADVETRELQAGLALARKTEEEHKKLHEAFMSREIHPEALSRVMAVVRRAAEQGKCEVILFQFPSEYCADRGRAINNAEPDWPRSLEGFAKRAYEAYEQLFKPHGYKLQARILDYPKGMPGNIGFFLMW
jgi:hypothetical protein